MPKLCDGCAFYSPDNDRTKCPICDGPLKITFLPPPGEKAAPIAGLPTDPVAELSRRHRAAGGSRVNWLLVKAVCAVLVTATLAGVRLYLRQEAREEREAQAVAARDIHPGMHISEAAQALEAGSPRWRGSTRHDFDPDDDSDGTMEVNDGRQDLRITWRNGYVVEVERAAGSGGTQRRVTVVTARPEIEADGVPDPDEDEAPRVPKPTGGNR